MEEDFYDPCKECMSKNSCDDEYCCIKCAAYKIDNCEECNKANGGD